VTSTDRERDIERLRRYREIAATLGDAFWTVESEDGQARVVCTRPSGEMVTVALLGPDVLPEELELVAGAVGLLGFFLTMQDRATAKVKELLQQTDDAAPSPYADSAADLCANVQFRQFLETKGPRTSVPDPRRADNRLKAILDFRNARQLDSDPELLARFRALIVEFDSWKRRAA
jgi:hypothetical protein